MLLKKALRSNMWEVFMCSNICVYCVGMGVADIDVEWKDIRWETLCVEAAVVAGLLVFYEPVVQL